MLCNLVIENYALISKLEIEFRKGLTIVTGETGAGKSILLGALSLILGKRADTSVLYQKEKKCIVEGTFDITRYGLEDYFAEKGLDYDNHTIIRRDISTAGKSRAFINDTPVNLELLSDLGVKLIDIHSQHQNLNLANSIFQMKAIDSYAKNQDLLSEYKTFYRTYQDIETQYKHLSDEAARSRTETDYLQFQLTQLEEARLIEGEQEELEYELEQLTHAEDIKTGLTDTCTLLQGEGNSALQLLKEASTAIGRISKFLHEQESLFSRIESAYIEVKDIARETEVLNNQIYYDPDRLNQINDRLNIIYDLEKKHRLSTLNELIALREEFKQKINHIHSYDLALEELARKQAGTRSVLNEQARKLAVRRRQSVISFEQRVIEMLHDVGIPHAGFSIKLENQNEFTESGTDRVQFLFSANKNMPLQDIARVASGGELSRLMLCVKSLMSDSIGLPTIIFDEIDTGVSGEIAEKVGNIINRMADKMQIINITHLPQVASKGKNHYLVYKTDGEKSPTTRMKLLTPEERRIEIAKMLSGEEVTSAALDNAKALLGE